ncbi:ABC transporter substrate-binding protein [Euzebya pacifica]|uniref:ABC transporter substrate-binding protein n=1 Tax=Euzebya pacifica TaxID=1608957 RepID=UPI0030FCEA37
MQLKSRTDDPNRGWRLILVVMALALVAAACGSDAGEDDTAEATEDSAPEIEAPDEATEADEEADDPAPTETASETDRGEAGDAADTAGSGGDIVVGVGAINPDLDAFSATSPPRSFYAYPVWSLMTRVDTLGDDAEIAPGVAESWTRVDDLTWDFTLREGLEFANGEPVDAAAVIYSINFVLDADNEAGIRGKLSIIETVEETDDGVRITMNEPEAILPRLLGAMPIVPPVLHAEDPAAFTLNPIGTGAFMVEEFTPGERLVLVPNPNSGQGNAAPASITFELIPEDAARVAALQAGDVDIITKVPIDSVASLESDGFAIYDQVEPRTYVVDLFTTEGPLADVRVRQALAMAVDASALNEGIMGGRGLPADGQLAPEFMSGYCPDVEAYPYDPAAADALLAEAGATNLELVFQSSQGFLLNDSLMAQAIGEQINSLENVASVEIQAMEFSNFLDVFHGRADRADLYAWGMSSSPFVDASVQLERLVTDYPQHNIGYTNSDYDAAFVELRNSEEGTPERQAAFCELARIYREDVPQLAVMALPDVWAASTEIQGFAVDQAGNPAWEFVTHG